MIDVRGVEKLRATVLVLKNVERPVAREINTRTRTTMNPVWKGLVETHASRHIDARVLAKGARVKGGNPPVLVAASSRRPLGGGLVPATQWHAYEFGAAQDSERTYTRRSSRGRVHKVTRHTTRQLPRRIRKGRVVYPAVEEIVPRLVSLWVQTVVRTVMDGVDRGAR